MHVIEVGFADEEGSRYSIQLPFVPRIGERFRLQWFDGVTMSGIIKDVQWDIEYNEDFTNENKQYVSIIIVIERDE